MGACLCEAGSLLCELGEGAGRRGGGLSRGEHQNIFMGGFYAMGPETCQ